MKYRIYQLLNDYRNQNWQKDNLWWKFMDWLRLTVFYPWL